MSSPVRGIDVSSWQHPGGQDIDWDQVAGAGVAFALVKASQGTAYVNPWVAADIDGARGAGLLVGAYHYFEAGQGPEAQAAHFLACLVGQDLGMGAWLDWECYEPQNFTHSVEINGFLTAVREARPTCGMYVSTQWAEVLIKDQVPFGRLWVAAPGPDKPGLGELVWQYGTEEVAGVPAPVDVDRLANTRGVDIPTSPPPRPSAADVARVRALAEGELDSYKDIE